MRTVSSPLMMLAVAVTVTATGCKAPPEAPETLDELCGYLFAPMTDEEPDALITSNEQLDTWIAANP